MGRLAFAYQTAADGPFATLWIQRRAGSRSVQRIPRGAVLRKDVNEAPYGAPSSMDLGARALAFAWEFTGDYGFSETQIVRVELPSRTRRIVDGGYTGECYGDGYDSFYEPERPSVTATGVTFLAVSGPCDPSRSRFVIAAGSPVDERREWQPPDALAYAMASDGETFYWVRGPTTVPYGADPCAVGGGCQLVASRDLPFTPVAPRATPS